MSGLVSVIMPVYNGERFIAQAIDSVLTQTYPQWELIVVNDGSTDGTADILARYTDPRIRCTYQENQGLAITRNTGIRVATGEYLAFLDADDEWEPQFLQTCCEVLAQRHDLAAVYTRNVFIDGQGHRLPGLGGQTLSGPEVRRHLVEEGLFLGAMVARKDVIVEVGMFDTQLAGHGTEDWDLWLRIAYCYPILGIPMPLARYRVYPGTMSTNAAGMHACRLSVIEKHFGLEEGQPAVWPEEKRRAYGYGYRGSGLSFLAQADLQTGWNMLAKAALYYPAILADPGTFYGYLSGAGLRPLVNWPSEADLVKHSTDVVSWLDQLFKREGPELHRWRAKAYGTAHLTMALVADNAEYWNLARSRLFRAVGADPSLLKNPSTYRRIAKLCLPVDLVRRLRHAK